MIPRRLLILHREFYPLGDSVKDIVERFSSVKEVELYVACSTTRARELFDVCLQEGTAHRYPDILVTPSYLPRDVNAAISLPPEEQLKRSVMSKLAGFPVIRKTALGGRDETVVDFMDFLQQMDSYPRLSYEDISLLLPYIGKADMPTIDLIFQSKMHLIVDVAQQFKFSHYHELLEYISAGMIGLVSTIAGLQDPEVEIRKRCVEEMKRQESLSDINPAPYLNGSHGSYLPQFEDTRQRRFVPDSYLSPPEKSLEEQVHDEKRRIKVFDTGFDSLARGAIYRAIWNYVFQGKTEGHDGYATSIFHEIMTRRVSLNHPQIAVKHCFPGATTDKALLKPVVWSEEALLREEYEDVVGPVPKRRSIRTLRMDLNFAVGQARAIVLETSYQKIAKHQDRLNHVFSLPNPNERKGNFNLGSCAWLKDRATATPDEAAAYSDLRKVMAVSLHFLSVSELSILFEYYFNPKTDTSWRSTSLWEEKYPSIDEVAEKLKMDNETAICLHQSALTKMQRIMVAIEKGAVISPPKVYRRKQQLIRKILGQFKEGHFKADFVKAYDFDNPQQSKIPEIRRIREFPAEDEDLPHHLTLRSFDHFDGYSDREWLLRNYPQADEIPF